MTNEVGIASQTLAMMSNVGIASHTLAMTSEIGIASHALAMTSEIGIASAQMLRNDEISFTKLAGYYFYNREISYGTHSFAWGLFVRAKTHGTNRLSLWSEQGYGVR